MTLLSDMVWYTKLTWLSKNVKAFSNNLKQLFVAFIYNGIFYMMYNFILTNINFNLTIELD